MHYPPAVLVLLLILIVFVASLCFSVILSRQQQQIDRLIDETAILAAEMRDLKATVAGNGQKQEPRSEAFRASR